MRQQAPKIQDSLQFGWAKGRRISGSCAISPIRFPSIMVMAGSVPKKRL